MSQQTPAQPLCFPFTALLGQELLQTALLVNAVDPLIGGVLVRGHKGTGKSTAARALAGLLPPLTVTVDCPCHCDPDHPEAYHDECRQRLAAGETVPRERRPTPFVELPLSATEDRLVGTLELERTLATGRRHFQPGLLAAANRGVLYVDEVNLLPDHLVDLLLDVAASGINTVERDGVHYTHPARFLLIGTMNPEEGELRPQLLDRFGLCVAVSGLAGAELRREIVLRRLAFDRDPRHFRARFQPAEDALARQVQQARQRLERVAITSDTVDRAVALAAAARAQGHRGELALVRTARALAALCDREVATSADLAEAARLVLPHRLDGGTDPERGATQLAELIETVATGDDGLPAPPVADEPLPLLDNMDFPGSAAAGSMLFTYLKKKVLSAPSPPTTTAPSARRRCRRAAGAAGHPVAPETPGTTGGGGGPAAPRCVLGSRCAGSTWPPRSQRRCAAAGKPGATPCRCALWPPTGTDSALSSARSAWCCSWSTPPIPWATGRRAA
jgi:Mg-chelatase subunit ChlI